MFVACLPAGQCAGPQLSALTHGCACSPRALTESTDSFLPLGPLGGPPLLGRDVQKHALWRITLWGHSSLAFLLVSLASWEQALLPGVVVPACTCSRGKSLGKPAWEDGFPKALAHEVSTGEGTGELWWWQFPVQQVPGAMRRHKEVLLLFPRSERLTRGQVRWGLCCAGSWDC